MSKIFFILILFLFNSIITYELNLTDVNECIKNNNNCNNIKLIIHILTILLINVVKFHIKSMIKRINIV